MTGGSQLFGIVKLLSNEYLCLKKYLVRDEEVTGVVSNKIISLSAVIKRYLI